MTRKVSLSADQCARLARPTMTAFLAGAQDWQLDSATTREIAGGPPPQQFAVWLRALAAEDPLHIGPRRLIRLGAITGVHAAIRRVLPNRPDRIRWLTHPSRGPACRGQSPLNILRDADDLVVIGFREAVDDWLMLPGLTGAKIVSVQSETPQDQDKSGYPKS